MRPVGHEISLETRGSRIPPRLSARVAKTALALFIPTLVAAGCVAPVIPPPGEDFSSALSQTILFPQLTCEDLRAFFKVDYLPVVDNPAQQGVVYEEHYLLTPNDQIIRVWYVPAALNRGTVLLSPGNSGPMQCYLYVPWKLNELGWSVVMYEYEGFGYSSGRPSLDALAPDLETVLDWTRAYLGLEKLTLMGLSLGTVPSTAIAAKRPEAVNGLIMDSPFSLPGEFERISFLLTSRAEEYIDRLDSELLTDETIGGVRCPTLIYLHELDILTPIDTVKVVLASAPPNTEVVTFEDLDHARGAYFDTGKYLFHADRFLTNLWAKN
ncbi:MAG: alpha/beta fold hydrolase [Phycisphaerales bacterium]|nr:alpha/beta fold hydrolase [Phycisphaerales bacterium]